MNNPSFKHYPFSEGASELYDGSETKYPYKLHSLKGCGWFDLDEGSTYYFFVYSDAIWINDLPITKNMYGQVTRSNSICFSSETTETEVIIIEKIGEESPFLIGGPIEKEGRLKYIDGCTDSLLLPPTKYGMACLNHLHFPSNINQTPHTHPSVRVGIVAKGHGECVTPFGNIPLVPGQLFLILPEDGNSSIGIDGELHNNGTHCFRTFDEEMDVIAFHPDSDFGPKDEEHPMINMTIVDGTSAKFIDSIKTK